MDRDDVVFYAKLSARLAQRHTDREGALDCHGLDNDTFDALERTVVDALAAEPPSGPLRAAFVQAYVEARTTLGRGPVSDDDSESTARWPQISAHPLDALDTTDGSDDDELGASKLLEVMETLHSPGNKSRSSSG
jgi:hypothetical protein